VVGSVGKLTDSCLTKDSGLLEMSIVSFVV
jgi:hypothetical protein